MAQPGRRLRSAGDRVRAMAAAPHEATLTGMLG